FRLKAGTLSESAARQKTTHAPRQTSPCRALLVLLLMRGAEVRKLLENVGVRFQTAGRAFALGQEREAVINHVVSEDAAVGILRRLRWIETQHVGQCSLLDLGNRFFARVISRVAH